MPEVRQDYSRFGQTRTLGISEFTSSFWKQITLFRQSGQLNNPAMPAAGYAYANRCSALQKHLPPLCYIISFAKIDQM
ncbi:MAG: hypothetical protein HWQ43_31390 [Nostoc sp. JL31]|uniref:hypothetical protein n=1 Tax=Nostoc sp. JL31 TaxID=2815395 RepID=UPI0025CEBAAA|nr:hypothetical protein [Nostoc sp. JL31]MBN3893425.1 hypothetical protein [Nostoc sp. JL31]